MMYIPTIKKFMVNKTGSVLNANVFIGANVLSFVTREACDQDRTYFIGHSQKSLHRNCSLSSYSRHVWHMSCHLL